MRKRRLFCPSVLESDGYSAPLVTAILHFFKSDFTDGYSLYQFVLVELEEEVFAPHEVWRATLDRFEKRAHAKQVSIQADILLADSRGEDPPDVSLKKNPLKPLGEFHPGTGAIEWDATIIDSLTALATRPKPPPSRKGGAKTKPPHPPPQVRGS